MFARQGSSESDLRIPMKCVNAMPDDIVVLGRFIIARQGPSEHELSISTRYVFSMFDEKVEDEAQRSSKINPK